LVTNRLIDNLFSKIHSTWTRYSSTLLYLAIGLALLSVALRFFPELYRLLFVTEHSGAVDLRLRYGEIQRWFVGLPVYTDPSHAGYPPASYVLLYPFFGLLDESATRWLWGAVSLVELSLLAVLTIRFTETTTRLEKLLIVLTFISVYPITVTLGNGQLGIHVFTLFWCGLLLLTRRTDWRIDLLAAVLLIFALVKPSFSVPLYWIVLFALGRLRPMVLVGFGYILLTGFALAFQPDPRLPILIDFFKYNADVINSAGGAHIAVWMRLLGLSEWTTVASLIMFFVLGTWVFWNRRANIWLLLGASAIVARLWTYHRMYDDLLILFAMIALLQWLRKNGTSGTLAVFGGCLVGAAWLAMQMPASTVTFPFPWNLPYEIGLPLIWGSMLFLLVYLVWHERTILNVRPGTPS
jgi:hypothetical protein